MKKQFIAAGIAATMGIAGLGAGVASAATSSNTENNNPMSSLVDAISTKFNLDKAEVQAVFDEQRSTMETEREAQIKEDVAKLVTDGKITQAQADLINAKRAELKTEREANRGTAEDKTHEERKAAMEAKRAELKSWASQNGISEDYLKYVMGGGHGGPGHHLKLSKDLANE